MAFNADDYINKMKERAQEIADQVLECMNEATQRASDRYIELVDERIQECFRDAVAAFYDNYQPKYYDRNESLYDILDTELTGESYWISFHPENMTPYRTGYTGEDGLYQTVFKEGWHGGAAYGEDHPSPGVPHWRTPEGIYRYWGRRAAKAADSPFDDFKYRLQDYADGLAHEDFQRIWSEEKRLLEREIQQKFGARIT